MVDWTNNSDAIKPWAKWIGFRDNSYYLLLLIPTILFLVSLYVPPTIVSDSAVGFLALRSMLEGGPFNSITSPDPANIAYNVATFVTFWSPGQYLVPGLFIWLGTNYGLALSLTTLIATLVGVLGWIEVARSFHVSSYVLFVFAFGLTTFPYVTQRFLGFWGGELLLFATAPWSLYAMRWSANKPAILCFTISLLSAALLFFAKLTGLIVFATNVVAISLLTIIIQRRLRSSIIAMWAASVIAALCFTIFWLARGPVAADGSAFSFSWLPIWFSVTGVAFSGIYGLALLLGHSWLQINSELASELLGPVALLLMVWVWFQLRHTCYRNMAILLFVIILVHAIILTGLWLHGADIPFEDRHFRYAGILFFLLLLTAVDQRRVPLAKGLACSVVILLGVYGVRNYATFASVQMRAGDYDLINGISQDVVTPTVLEHMRAEVTQHNFQHPIAVIPSASAAISLPRFRIIYFGWERRLRAGIKWAGRAEKIFVIVPEEMGLNGEAEAILRSFTDYNFDNWNQLNLDGMIIYCQ